MPGENLLKQVWTGPGIEPGTHWCKVRKIRCTNLHYKLIIILITCNISTLLSAQGPAVGCRMQPSNRQSQTYPNNIIPE